MTLNNQNRLPWFFKGWLAFGAFLVAALTGCGEPASQQADGATQSGALPGQFKVVATTTILEDLARNLAGDDAHVVGIMRAGEDPHIYKVRPRDADTLAAADLILSNGLHLEATLGKVIDQVAPGKVVRLADKAGIEPLGLEVYQGAPDPHVWMDVQHFKRLAIVAREALVAADPDHAAGYMTRAEAYLKQLDELDAWVREQFAAIPPERRVIVTSHDAFNYYARAYEVEVHGVIGISTDAQPTPQDVDALRSLVKDRGVRALFIETSTSPALNNIVTRIATEGGLKVGGTLYSDSLGGPDEPGGTYIGMIRANTTTIVEALR